MWAQSFILDLIWNVASTVWAKKQQFSCFLDKSPQQKYLVERQGGGEQAITGFSFSLGRIISG